MGRHPRQTSETGYYHVVTRGNHRAVVFREDIDYRTFCTFLQEAFEPAQIRLAHFCLMPNHTHLLLYTDTLTMLSRAMRGLHLSYAWHYRKRYRYHGHLWQGRFRSLRLLDANRSLSCGRSLEQHPVRSGLATTPDAYPWSSYRVYANGAQHPFLIQNPHYETLGNAAPERQERYQRLDCGIVPPRTPGTSLDQTVDSVAMSHPLAPLDEVWMFPITRRPRGKPYRVRETVPGTKGTGK